MVISASFTLIFLTFLVGNYNCTMANSGAISREYHELEQDLVFPDVPGQEELFSIALQHPTKNRYEDILPFDKTIVKMEDPTEYINANYVKIENDPVCFISTQAPLVSTFATFWKMVWEHSVPVIIMLTRLQEGQRVKAEAYWPSVGETLKFGDITVTTNSQNIIFGHLIVRELNIQKNEETRTICHIQYTEWPDFGVPESSFVTLKLLDLLDEKRKEYSNHISISLEDYIVIHCSAGVGRTGTFIAIRAALNQLRDSKEVRVRDIVSSLREQRMAMVQRDNQYHFIFKVIYEYQNLTSGAENGLGNYLCNMPCNLF